MQLPPNEACLTGPIKIRWNFGRQAVELVRSSGGSIRRSLTSSVKQTEVDSDARRDGLTSDEREALRRLRRENRRLTQEREMLNAAAAFFARETTRR